MEVMRRIREHGVISIALSSCCWNPRPWNGLVLGYGAFKPSAIEQAMRAIGRVLREMKPGLSPAQPLPRRAARAYQAKGEKR
jgi:DNA-binding transcriptional MocR family regulator